MRNPKIPSVLILGARGRFGLAAARAFALAGWRVLGQMRPGATAPALAGVTWLAQDVFDTPALAAACADVQVVLHALNPPYSNRHWQEQAPALMDAAVRVTRQLGATLMLPGNVYNFGTGMPSVLHEDSPQRPDTVKGHVRVALEQRLEQATRDGGMRAVVLRAGDFFGGGTGSWFDQAITSQLRHGKLVYPGGPGIRTPWVFLPDLAQAFVQVAQARERLGAFATLHFAGYSIGAEEWLEALNPVAREHGWVKPGTSLKLGSLPWTLIRLGSSVRPGWAALTEMRYLWRTPHALANERLNALIGAEPHTPLAQAVRAALGQLGLSPGNAQRATTFAGAAVPR